MEVNLPAKSRNHRLQKRLQTRIDEQSLQKYRKKSGPAPTGCNPEFNQRRMTFSDGVIASMKP